MRGEASRSSELVGREGELAVLRAQLDQACAGAGSVVLLTGEPGIGKTRLAEELAADARLRGAQVLWGRCYEGEGAPAYWPWVQIIRGYVRGQDPATLRAEIEAGGADLAALVPELRTCLPHPGEPPALEPAQARFRLFNSLVTLFANAAARTPLVLILDDLHWADRPSLLLLRFLGREVGQARCLVLGTYRGAEVGRQHPLTQTLAELAREQVSQRIPLGGLSEREIARFIGLTAGLEPPEGLAAVVSRGTEGNPFFVTEVVRLLLAEGRLERPEPLRAWSLTIPPSVREVIGRRLERLSEPTNRVLAVAAVVGREFNLAVLQRVCGLETEALLEALEEAENAGVIMASRSLGSFSFSHALIRETLYEELPTTRRVRLHGLVGETLESVHGQALEPHLSELAHHFYQAAPAGDASRAVAYGWQAGERALGLLAYEEAAEQYERALEALRLAGGGGTAREGELRLILGEALRKSGEPRRAMETLHRAAELGRRLGETELLARAALGFEDAVLQSGAARSGAGSPSVGLLEEARVALGEGESGLKARVLAALARALYFSSAEARGVAYSREAVEAARRGGDEAAELYALNVRRIVMWGPDNLEERLAVTGEIVRLARAIGDREMALDGHQWRQYALLEQGDAAAAEAEIEAYVRLAEELRQPLYRCYVPALRASQALLAGRLAEAERLAERALELGRRAQSENVEQIYAAQMFVLRREQGRLGELESALRGFARQYPTARTWRAVLAALFCEVDCETEARRWFESLAVEDFADLPRSYVWLVNVALLSEVCTYLGDAGRAERLYRLLRPYAARNIMGTSVGPCWGSAERYLGLLATTTREWGAAARHFESALERQGRLGARAWLARSQYDYARMLLARGASGDRARAAGLLTRSLDGARELGMGRLAEQVRSVQAGSRERGASLQRAGLTRREVEILRLVAEGRSNREIAEELVLSVRTVEHHLANAYARIGARGRAEAIAYVLRKGILPADPSPERAVPGGPGPPG